MDGGMSTEEVEDFLYQVKKKNKMQLDALAINVLGATIFYAALQSGHPYIAGLIAATILIFVL